MVNELKKEKKFWLISIGVFFLVSLILFLSIPPTTYPDTADYMRISRYPIGLRFFSDRPALAPLVFGFFNGNVVAITWFQYIFYLLSWLSLGISIFLIIQNRKLRLVATATVLAISLNKDLFFWNNLLLSESVSISTFALMCAVWLWALRILIDKREDNKLIFIPLICSAIWALARDTNAWALLAASLFSLLAVFFTPRKVFFVSITIGLLLIFIFQNHSSNVGGRWKFPFVNIVGQRILPDPVAREYFRNHGMPVEKISQYSGKWASTFNRDWSGFGDWLDKDAKSVYMKYLLSKPFNSIWQPIYRWQDFLTTSPYRYSGNNEAPMWQRLYSYVVYPKGFRVPLFLLVIILFTSLLIRHRVLFKKHGYAVLFSLVLLMTSYASVFVSWHGDAMEVVRHSLGFSLQLRMALWLVLFFSLDLLISNSLIDLRGRKAKFFIKF
ncbi:MAG: hypothetical protein AB7F43_04490 [Bacteriovoracia bacterium]